MYIQRPYSDGIEKLIKLKTWIFGKIAATLLSFSEHPVEI